MSIAIDTLPNVPTTDYNTLRHQIRSGDVLLCSGNGVFSSLIQQATKSIWSHVAFIIRLDVIGRIMVFESVESIGVRTVPLSSYVQNYNGSGKGYDGHVLIARNRAFNPENIVNISKTAVNFLGYPYNKEEIVRIAARIGLRMFDTEVPQADPLSSHAFICSEYAYDCYASVGVTIPYDKLGFIAPSDFAKDPAIDPIALINIQN